MNEYEKEHFEERAAICEFDGGMSCEEAEIAALEETKTVMFRCLIRQLIRWNLEGRRADVIRWLDKADIQGGRDPADRKVYADALNEQIKLGNKGSAGEWK